MQDGTPSPDSPKPIASVTQAAVVACGKNMCSDDELTNISWAGILPRAVHLLNRTKGKPITITYTATLISADDEAKVSKSMLGVIVKGKSGKPYTNKEPWGDGAGIGTTKTIVYSFTVAPDDEITDVWTYGCGNSNDSPDRTNGRADASIQIEMGADATEYEPYHESNLPINLQGNELCSLPNGVRDEVRIDKDGNVELVKRVGVCPMPKAEAVGDGNTQVGADGTHNRIVSFLPPANAASGNGASCVCTHFTDGGTTKNRDTIRFGADSSFVYIYTSNADVLGTGTKESIDKWMTTNGVKLLYPLATPEIIPLGKVEIPTLPAPVCNAWVESDVPTECAVRYVRDMNIVIAKLEKQLAAVAGATI